MLSHTVKFAASAALVGITAFAAAPALAQQSPPIDSEAQSEKPEDDFHNRGVDESGVIIVSAAGLRQLDLLAGTSIMEGAELQRNLDGQIGEVLARLPGVSATSFSPGASRPVLRGFQGARVRVLIDGIGSIDVSNTSADHAVSIDPLTAERIEVLRGPAVLLYGNQAIGGAVNVIDKRIPRRLPGEAIHADVLAGTNSAANLYEGGASIDLPVGDQFAFHIDGSYRNTDDLSVGGFTAAPQLRAALLTDALEEEAEGEFEEAEELREAADQRGILPGSFTETFSANAGFAIFVGSGTLGAAVGIYDTNYGVPGRPGAENHHGEEAPDGLAGAEEEERVSIDLRQYRADLRGEVPLGGGFFEKLTTRAGFSDYIHTEFEGDEVGTVFEVQGIEVRAELVQAQRNGPIDGLGGAIGVQYTYRDFQAIGAEAFVAPNITESLAIFALQEYGPGPIQLEVGGRYETNSVDSAPLGIERNFDTISGAIGLAYETDQALRAGFSVSRAERAPSAEELFSNGPHIATQAFEIGDPNLSEETALGGEIFIRGRIGLAEVAASAYYTSFDDFIYETATGAREDDLPVFVFLQDDAKYYGVEGQVRIPFFDNGAFGLTADLRGDYVRAELDDGSPLPRIPPLSLLGALEMDTGPVLARAEVQWFAEQNRTAAFETPTADFTLVNASITWKPMRGRDNVTVLAQVDNIFDSVGRRHASFTKDFVLLSGRNFKVSVKASF